ncbi:MAG: SDR family oxidoreductase [Balneolaceae bacterium]
MKLLVLGASGGCGKEVVKQALAKGFTVTVVLRESSEYLPPEEVHVVKGDVLHPDFIKELVKDHYNIISCLGIKRSNPFNPWSRLISPNDLTTRVVSNVIQATGDSKNTTFIAISAAGVGESFERTNLMMRIMIPNSNIGIAYADLAQMEESLSKSNLNWLAVRPVTLINSSTKKPVQLTSSYGLTSMISRANVAKWMLDQLDKKEPFSDHIQMIKQ